MSQNVKLFFLTGKFSEIRLGKSFFFNTFWLPEGLEYGRRGRRSNTDFVIQIKVKTER